MYLNTLKIIPLIVVLTSICFLSFNSERNKKKSINTNQMSASWHFEDKRIFFEMSAPTSGWLTIGFNTNDNLKGAYLLMGHIVDGQTTVVEYFVNKPGDYNPIDSYAAVPQVLHVEGSEKGKETIIKFSLPIKSKSDFQKNLNEGQSYTMILAYSQEKDFQHHSSMRTSVEVIL